MITTDAWVLSQGTGEKPPIAGELRLEKFNFELADDDVLVEPIYGCWEGNMTHALLRDPIDVCSERREERVVLGNAGVVRVLKPGPAVTDLPEGTLCGVAPIGNTDRFGNLLTVMGYDARNTMGLLAKRMRMKRFQLVVLPQPTKHALKQWAAFSLRYSTAWANWRVAFGSFRTQISETEMPTPWVWGWGGGVALAEVMLAKRAGCQVALVASTDDRLALIRELGIHAIDRRLFPDLHHGPNTENDREARNRYLRSEIKFLRIVKEVTGGEGVSIFIDNIGTPVFRATLRALARQGVVTTCGWKQGMDLTMRRAPECIAQHLHVNTHGCRLIHGVTCMQYGEVTGWMAPIEKNAIWSWDDVPKLAADYAAGHLEPYFPLYQVNPE